MSKNIIKRYSLDTLSDVTPQRIQSPSGAVKEPIRQPVPKRGPSILEQIEMMTKNATALQKPKPQRRVRTKEQENQLIVEIITELQKREKEKEKTKSRMEAVSSTKKEKERKERMVRSRESARKYLSQKKDKPIEIKSKVKRKSISPKRKSN